MGDTVDAVERDVLAPAARIMFDAFAPEWNTRVQMSVLQFTNSVTAPRSSLPQSVSV
jgi:hypothetical protein